MGTSLPVVKKHANRSLGKAYVGLKAKVKQREVACVVGRTPGNLLRAQGCGKYRQDQVRGVPR